MMGLVKIFDKISPISRNHTIHEPSLPGSSAANLNESPLIRLLSIVLACAVLAAIVPLFNTSSKTIS